MKSESNLVTFAIAAADNNDQAKAVPICDQPIVHFGPQLRPVSPAEQLKATRAGQPGPTAAAADDDLVSKSRTQSSCYVTEINFAFSLLAFILSDGRTFKIRFSHKHLNNKKSLRTIHSKRCRNRIATKVITIIFKRTELMRFGRGKKHGAACKERLDLKLILNFKRKS